MGSTESSLPLEETDANINPNEEQEQIDQADQQQYHREQDTGENAQDIDDPWWWEIENQNLLLHVVPPEQTPLTSESVRNRVTVRALVNCNRDASLCKECKSSPSISDATVSVANESYCVSEKVKTTKRNSLDNDIDDLVEARKNRREQSLEEFKEELRIKRMARHSAVQDLRTEITTLRQQLAEEKELTRRLRNGEIVDEISSSSELLDNESTEFSESEDNLNRSRKANIDLADAQLALQLANADNLSLRTELSVVRKQVVSLKEVIACCKQMISVKEEQCDQLKNKLRQIEESLAERELKIMSDHLRQEYDRQLANIRTLRQLYEERQRVSAAERENLERQISIKKDELVAEQERTKNFEERNQTLEKEVEIANNELASLREECNEHKFENKALNEEMGAVNKLFSQMLMGFNGTNNLDIDRLTTMLEENRTLLNDMATKEAHCSDGATLPKLLFELVQQAAVGSGAGASDSCSSPEYFLDTTTTIAAQSIDAIGGGGDDGDVGPGLDRTTEEVENVQGCVKDNATKTAMTTMKFYEPEVIGKVASAQEIIGNLPKVWKVLMELLSHHKIEQVQFKENGLSEDCYKSVETPNGPKAELSVSKTYIKLKDLILEKKSLVKETNRLKTLNCHLEYRLNEQEKRLSTVSLELTKTWHLVGKMQRQHRQLHTQEQILRYQLQQKRRLLNELKDELEYCRRKWAAARAKNDESQVQCDDLRREFAKRKLEDASSHSAESGYSDSGPVSDEDDAARGVGDGAVVSSPRMGEICRTDLSEMFKHARKIKRMQSTSPGRADFQGDIMLRWNSAPPTVAWSGDENMLPVVTDGDDNDDGGDDTAIDGVKKVDPFASTGAIPKRMEGPRSSRSKIRGKSVGNDIEGDNTEASNRSNRATRIQRLENQCQSLIAQVLQTSDYRERLEIQLCRFQDEIAPVQYAVPIDEFISRKSVERMTRASSAPVMNSPKAENGTLTPREEEYTRKRSERLERLEEESRQLMSRIRRTSDRGNYLRSSMERIHSKRAISRDGSFESNTEEMVTEQEESAISEIQYQPTPIRSPLSVEEEAYTVRRSERLKRLEEESKQLLSKLSCNANRGTRITSKLDALHTKYGNDDHRNEVSSQSTSSATTATSPTSPTIEKRIENIAKISSNRDERLRILEEEGKQLLSRLSSTSKRGTLMINRIAEREQHRNARQSAALDSSSIAEATSAATSESSAASTLLPTPKTVACTSIVSEEISERVTITQTSSQIALAAQGAVPKSKSVAQLSASAKPKLSATAVSVDHKESEETLEEMVKRLRNLPFPEEKSKSEE